MIDGVLNFAKTRHLYGRTASWLLAAYNRILRRTALPLPLRGSLQKIFITGENRPLVGRLGSSDLLVMEEIFFQGEYAEVAETLSEPINLIVDLGSNVGYSLRYWHRAFPEARMIAVEPDPENAKLCMANVQMAGFADFVNLHVACAGSHARSVSLSVDTEAWAMRMEEHLSCDAESVPVLTVPDLLAELPENQPIDLLKCDIEGAEAELFGNCEAWIHRVRNVIVELHAPYTVLDFYKDLDLGGAGFNVVSVTKQDSFQLVYLRRGEI